MEEAPAFDLGYVARVRKIAETTFDGKRILIQELLPWYGDFKEEPVIQAKVAGTNRLVAYAGFRVMHGNAFTDVRPDIIELQQLKVLPQYRKGGFANAFLGLILHVANQAQVPLSLKPDTTSDRRLTTEELTSWYGQHGFRQFSREDITRMACQKHLAEINRTLLFAGYEPETGELTGPKIHSLERQKIEAMNAVPEERRIELYRRMLIKEYGNGLAHLSNLRIHDRTIEQRMIREPGNPVYGRLLARFKINSRYRFPTLQRLTQTWEAIHKAGKRPRKQPVVSQFSSHSI